MTRRPRRLVLVGSVIADVMLSVPELPPRGGDVIADRAAVNAGGGYVVLASAHRLGLPVCLAGRIGTGPFGLALDHALRELGMDVLLPAGEEDSGFTVGLVEPDGERTFLTMPGAESHLSADELSALAVEPDDAVYVSGYDLCYLQTGPAIATWISTQDSALVVLDPGPLAASIPDAVLAQVLSRVDLLTLNARELGLLGGLSSLRPRLGPDAILLVRDGARGCTVQLPGAEAVQVDPVPVESVDTTGAGDTHTGALLAELSRTDDVLAAARVANAAAAYSVAHWGSATGPTRDQLEGFSSGRASGTPPASG